ncbi:MAG: hypothetical protein H7239_08475 [Flavobacterium sp.]|nr:hypothetical protein [Flavobacterium sp.]
MDNYTYLCQYCGHDYIPKRRLVQKYCSNSCRTRAYQLRNPKIGLGVSVLKKETPKSNDKMSWSGFANAAAGAAAVKIVENVFTAEGNKPATKNDIKNLTLILKNRYQPILNIPNRIDGAKPFYDTYTQQFLYLIAQK